MQKRATALEYNAIDGKLLYDRGPIWQSMYS